jgi:hypothetical protein
MAHQNRVQPDGTILAHSARGTFMGNRGVLHDAAGQLTHRRWRHKAWVCCQTKFNGRRRVLLSPNRYTELFFHDEAVAFAAGHRPCGECRRDDYRRFCDAIGHKGNVKLLDDRLHAARAVPYVFQQLRRVGRPHTLPDGTMFLDDAGAIWLIWQGKQWRYQISGYDGAVALTRDAAMILTPRPYIIAFANGYKPSVAALSH